MQIQAINLPPLTLPQMRIKAHPSKRKVIAAGKRFGKTQLSAILCHEVAARGGIAWWIARTYKVGAAGWHDIKALAQDIQRKTGLPLRIIDSEPFVVEYPNGGRIEVRAVGEAPNDLRGTPLDLVIFDEAAFIPHLRSAWLAVQTGLLDRKGTAYFISTPFGKNFFYELYQRGNPRSPNRRKGWQSFQYSTYDNPLLDPEDITAMAEEMDELDRRQEIYAEFIEGQGLVFRKVRSYALVPPGARPDSGHTYVFGVDWGRIKDYTVILVGDGTTKQIVHAEAFNKIDFQLQRTRLKALAAVWDPSVIWVEDNNVGQANFEILKTDGLPVRPFNTNGVSKQIAIDALVLAIESGELGLLDDKELLRQLENYQQFPLPGGGYKFGAPGGEHDDYVIAAMLLWHGMNKGKKKVRAGKMPARLEAMWGSFGGT